MHDAPPPRPDLPLKLRVGNYLLVASFVGFVLLILALNFWQSSRWFVVASALCAGGSLWLARALGAVDALGLRIYRWVLLRAVRMPLNPTVLATDEAITVNNSDQKAVEAHREALEAAGFRRLGNFELSPTHSVGRRSGRLLMDVYFNDESCTSGWIICEYFGDKRIGPPRLEIRTYFADGGAIETNQSQRAQQLPLPPNMVARSFPFVSTEALIELHEKLLSQSGDGRVRANISRAIPKLGESEARRVIEYLCAVGLASGPDRDGNCRLSREGVSWAIAAELAHVAPTGQEA